MATLVEAASQLLPRGKCNFFFENSNWEIGISNEGTFKVHYLLHSNQQVKAIFPRQLFENETFQNPFFEMSWFQTRCFKSIF